MHLELHGHHIVPLKFLLNGCPGITELCPLGEREREREIFCSNCTYKEKPWCFQLLHTGRPANPWACVRSRQKPFTAQPISSNSVEAWSRSRSCCCLHHGCSVSRHVPRSREQLVDEPVLYSIHVRLRCWTVCRQSSSVS